MLLERWNRRNFIGLATVAALALPLAGMAAPAKAADTVVFAAASLKNALDDAAALYTATTGKTVTANYAASSALAKQIEEKAPADIFFSADLAWMDYLQERDLIKTDTRVTLLGNTIVLVAPADSTVALTLEAGARLADALGADGKLAMANVDSVPAGKYGKAALEALAVWPSVQARVAQAENVRATLALVARGEAPAGIVYATDAAAEKGVKMLDAFPANTHPPIVYPAAVLADSRHGAAQAYLDTLRSPAAKAVFEKNGFTLLAPDAKVN